MREILTFIISWLTVTIIMFLTLLIDEYPLPQRGAKLLVLFAITAFLSGAYFSFFGIPAYYLLLKCRVVKSFKFLFTGILGAVASILMFIFSIYTGVIEWIIVSIPAGIIGGLIFAVFSPSTTDS